MAVLIDKFDPVKKLKIEAGEEFPRPVWRGRSQRKSDD